jgi:hypothetical protein
MNMEHSNNETTFIKLLLKIILQLPFLHKNFIQRYTLLKEKICINIKIHLTTCCYCMFFNMHDSGGILQKQLTAMTTQVISLSTIYCQMTSYMYLHVESMTKWFLYMYYRQHNADLLLNKMYILMQE